MADGKRELHELRQQIAEIDGQLLAMLSARAKTSRRIGDLRKEHPPSLPQTDGASLRELVAGSTGDMPEESLREIFTTIFSSCLALELPIQVAFHGLEGGPAHSAARQRFGQTAALHAVESTTAALEEVSRKSAEFALVPFENSIDGPLNATIAALTTSELRVVEMLDVALELHLLNRGGHEADIKRVFATAADAALCGRALRALGTHPEIVAVQSPLLACQAAVADSDVAALAPDNVGTAIGLVVARRSMLDVSGARARYAMVGKRPSGRSSHEATMFVFSVQDAPGSLIDVLKVLAERTINLTRIQSHPIPGETWSYIFCAEVTGHFTDRPLVVAVEEIKRVTRFFKLLGSYPVL